MSQARLSKLPTNMSFSSDEHVIIHVTGDSDHRTIIVEHFNRTFDLYSIRTNPATSSGQYRFSLTCGVDNIDTTRVAFRTFGFYCAGICVSKNEAIDMIRSLKLNEDHQFDAIDTTISDAFYEVTHRKNLFDPDPESVKQISTAKTKYDLWLEKWFLIPETKDFASVQDHKARKLLQLLQEYLCGGGAGRFFSGHWKLHHCDAIEKTLAPFKIPTVEHKDDIVVSAPADDDMTDVPLETSSRDATVKDILLSLSDEINRSKKPDIKPHGELFNLLEVIKDHTQVDYFALESQSETYFLSADRY